MNLDRSILIVDDEQAQARIYSDQFLRQGWSATAVFRGEDAVDAVTNTEFGVVLLDMRMPGMDGFETLKAILKVRPDQCVVFFTGFGDVASAVRALRQGAWSMVLKDGIRFQDLFESVEVALQRKTRELTTRRERDAALTIAAKMESTPILANGCAHTVKNRLAAVTSRLDLAETATTLDEAKGRVAEAREQLGKAFFAIKRLERICKVQYVELSVVRLVDAVSQAFEATKQGHSHHSNPKIRFAKKLSDAVHVRADAQFLAEALENVFSNSVEAMVSDGGSIELICECSEGFADIMITDTGPGFTEEMLTCAHEPFRTTKGNTNFGYGLTFAKEVAECCGGSLDYGNRLDRTGAWVRIRLPLASLNAITG